VEEAWLPHVGEGNIYLDRPDPYPVRTFAQLCSAVVPSIRPQTHIRDSRVPGCFQGSGQTCTVSKSEFPPLAAAFHSDFHFRVLLQHPQLTATHFPCSPSSSSSDFVPPSSHISHCNPAYATITSSTPSPSNDSDRPQPL